MLHHGKLFKELAQTTTAYFVDYAREQREAREIWDKVAHDIRIADSISSQEWPYLVPRWKHLLGSQIQISTMCNGYSVFAIDGSQIYPDRHQGMACYLINIGIAYMSYGIRSSAYFSSQPFLMALDAHQHDESCFFIEQTPDFVNCQRTEFEFKNGLETGLKHQAENPLFLFDGSLIFWHLESKEEAVKNRFLMSYCALLQQLYNAKILHAGYISLPKSRELVNILRAVSSSGIFDGLQYDINLLVDSDVVRFFLNPGYRTIIFENRSPIINFYPSLLKPYFFYMHNGIEIVRIEIPAWIARDEALVDHVAALILNQSVKGNGYPVCLAEAHEQAVVSTADRQLFYALLQKIMIQSNLIYPQSQKSIHKRILGI